jgi:hypothetical protein
VKEVRVSEAHAEPALARYRNSITELMDAGRPFGVIEDLINRGAELTEDSKAALWLFAFSRRDRADQMRVVHAHLASVC